MATKRGAFITLEGIEGVGKTTNLEFMAEYLRQRSYTVLTSREPGGTELAEALRELILSNDTEAPAPSTELLMMFAARAQHVAHVIAPALAAGQWVICDRFTDTTRAYQGYGRGMDLRSIEMLADIAHPGLRPDMTLLFDLSPEQSLARRAGRSHPDRIETEDFRFFAKAREGYLKIAQAEPDRIAVIDADCSLKLVQKQVLLNLESLLQRILN